jgi:hypothetical protein
MGKSKINLSTFQKDEVFVSFIQKLEDVERGKIILEISSSNFDITREQSKKLKQEQIEIVVEKLQDSVNYNSKSIDKLLKMSKILSDKELLKRDYLTTNWLDSLKVQEEYLTNFEEEEEETQKFRKEIEKNEREMFIDDIKIEKEQELQIETKRKKSVHFQKDLKIKIVFVDQMKEAKVQKGLRELFSPVISNIGSVGVGNEPNKFGFFHTALLVGPWLIEWNDSALCIPRKCLSKTAFLTADIGEISTIESLESIRDTLASTIVYWNVNKQYSTFSTSKNSGNCQDFVESILNELDMKIEFSGALYQFLSRIKKNGRSELIYTVNQEIKFDFQIRQDEIEFHTHRELDKFVNNLISKDKDFQTNYPNDYILLKSFDRAFWMKNFKLESEIEKFVKEEKQLKKYLKKCDDDENIKMVQDNIKLVQKNIQKCKEMLKMTRPVEISENGSSDCCPFDDPIATQSFVFEK